MVFDSYAPYYDLFYLDKNYSDEARYVQQLIETHSPEAASILDLGCGTGRHAYEFHELGYDVTAVDISSKMIEIAKKNSVGRDIEFLRGDVRNLRLDKKFDVVVALFHVMSYQTKDEDLASAFETAAEHLNEGGILIFDCWHGPAVLNDPPLKKVKKVSQGGLQLERIAQPLIETSKKIVTVNYKVHVRQNDEETIITENHVMRYLFQEEIMEIANTKRFEVKSLFEWMCFDKPEPRKCWNVVFVLKKISQRIKNTSMLLLPLCESAQHIQAL